MCHTETDKGTGHAAQSSRWKCDPGHYGPCVCGYPSSLLPRFPVGGKDRTEKMSHTPRILAERQITKGLLRSILFDNCTCPGVAQRTFWEYKILETTLWAF